MSHWFRSSWRFDRRAFAICLVFFAIEVVIALYFRDRFVRHFLGDVLVISLIGYFVRSFWAIRIPVIAVGTFIFACLVEVSQYFKVADWVGGRDAIVVQLTLGSTFDWLDILAYAVGAILMCMIARWSGNCAQ